MSKPEATLKKNAKPTDDGVFADFNDGLASMKALCRRLGSQRISSYANAAGPKLDELLVSLEDDVQRYNYYAGLRTGLIEYVHRSFVKVLPGASAELTWIGWKEDE